MSSRPESVSRRTLLDESEALPGSMSDRPSADSMATSQGLSVQSANSSDDINSTPLQTAATSHSDGNPASTEQQLPGPSRSMSTMYDLSTAQQKPMKRKLPRARYYAQALTEEDKHALAVGEKNHNKKEWTPEDAARFHEARPDLVPRGIEGREEILERLKNEKERCEQILFRPDPQSRRFSGLPPVRLTKPPCAPKLSTYNEQNFQAPRDTQISKRLSRLQSPQSMSDLRDSGSTSNSPALVEQSLNEMKWQIHSQDTNCGDYVTRPVVQPHSRQPSIAASRTSRSSNRVQSSLATDIRSYEYRSDVTFDSFLVPHASGKGEAYKGAENAKKEGVESAVQSPKSVEQRGVGMMSKRASFRHIRSMSSLPSLRSKKKRDVSSSSPLSE